MTPQSMFTLPETGPEPDPELVPAEPAGPAGPGSGNREPEPAPCAYAVPGPGSEPGPGSARTMVPGCGTGSEHGSGPGSRTTPTAQVLAVPAGRVSAGAGMLLSLRDHLAEIGENQKKHRTFWHAIWHWFWVRQPETLTEHCAYLNSLAWLEDWMTGSVRSFFKWENILYGIFVARPVKAACQNIDKIAERQFRFWVAVGAGFFCFIIWLVTHHIH